MWQINRRHAAAIAIALVAATARAEDFSTTVRKTFTFRGGTVSLDNRFGNVVVKAQTGSDVDVRATIRSSDAAFGQRIKVNASEGAGGISVVTEVPDVHMRNGSLSYSIDYEVKIPANAPLSVRNRFGNTEVSGLRAAGTINNAQGSVTMRDVGAKQSIENSFGAVSVSDAINEVSVRNQNGTVRVEHAGSADVTDRFGSVDVRHITRTAAIVNANGSVEVEDVGSAVAITNSFATVRATNIRGPLSITNENGVVDVRDVTSATSIRNSFARVTAS
ncbi:MAG: hypothetical protein ACXVH7_00130, partial [Thermoanaerobaculia bacterium]